MSQAHPPTATAHQAVTGERIEAWVAQFHQDGYLFLPGVLPADTTAVLRDDLDRVLHREPVAGGSIELHPRMFETSPTNVSLFNMEPIVTFAEALVERNCHVIHNNSFRTPTGGSGLSSWHQDDASHYVVTHGERPTNVHLPVLLFTANYYLTDVDTVAHGPTEALRRAARPRSSPGHISTAAARRSRWTGRPISTTSSVAWGRRAAS